jgi:hypothetical protein
MDALKELFEREGIDNVSIKTHILNSTLMAIADKEFGELSPTTAFGFVQILERDYDIDMGEWVSEYKAFINETPKSRRDSEVLPHHISEERDSGDNKIFMTFIILALLGVLAFLFYSYGKNLNRSSSYDAVTENQSIQTAEKRYVQEESKKVEEDAVAGSDAVDTASAQSAPEEQKTEAADESSVETDSTKQLQESVEEEAIEQEAQVAQAHEEQEQQKVESESMDYARAVMTQDETVQRETEESSEVSMPEESVAAEKITLEFSTKNRLWVGLLNPNTGKKLSYIIKSSRSFEIEDKTLIMTGHGYFSINANGESQQFQEKKGIRFFYNGGILNMIDRERYKEINSGKDW